ncbi:TatD family hydrolase [Luteimonas vadosa]|uniref:TatD family hydrolase n=1 Tax=Luteimonas vadosa TaxID=1165507 RepID=A0ABP9E6A7_9GAMM
MRLVDSHCHLDAAEFDDDRAAVIDRALAAGVDRQVVPATHADAWPGLRDACGTADGLHPAYGLHPTFLAHHEPAHLEALAEWIGRERPVAIGECGLDYYIDGLDRDRQQAFFDGQLRLARDLDLPVIVHARRAVDAVLASIRRIGGLRGVVHSFSGSQQQARQLWDLDFMTGIGGPVTYERAQRLRRLVAGMPIEYLLLETDAPDQPDARIRGERNEPARLEVVCRTIAQLRGESAESVARSTTANAERLFGLPARP